MFVHDINRNKLLLNNTYISNDFVDFNSFIGVPQQVIIPERIGLIQVHVVIESESNKDIEKVVQIFHLYPFIRYSFKFFKISHGLFLRLNPPKNTLYFIVYILSRLKLKNLIKKFDVFMSKGIRANIKAPPSISQSTEFDFVEWLRSIDSLYQYLPPVEDESYIISGLKRIHLDMLKILDVIPNIGKERMMDQVNLSFKEFEDEYQFLNNYLIASNLSENPINSNMRSYIIHISQLDEDQVLALFNLFAQNPIPYNVSIEINHDYSVFIWVEMDFENMLQFCGVIWDKYHGTELYMLDDRLGSKQSYQLDPSLFNPYSREWRIDKFEEIYNHIEME